MTLRLANLAAFTVCATVLALPFGPAAKADAQSDIRAIENSFIAIAEDEAKAVKVCAAFLSLM
jgi:hypothetical protein